MFNLNAEIIPSQSAAGVCLGDMIEGAIAEIEPLEIVSLHSCLRYEFGPISLWVGQNNRIEQIGLYKGYVGLLFNKIKIGSTIDDIQKNLGKVFEDENDSLVIESLSGLCFETEDWISSRQANPDTSLKITEICIFDPDEPEEGIDTELTFNYINAEYELAMAKADKHIIKQMRKLVVLGKKIEAIGLYRNSTGASLAEAHYIINKL